jgi:RNA polymerase primary sigma factor
MKPGEVAMFLTLGQESSLNAPIGEDGDSTHMDFLEDPNGCDPLAEMETGQMHSALHAALSELSDREKHVLMARFGVDQDDEQTLDELAQLYGVSRERIRQIEVRAKEKLRNGPQARLLKTFL